jgi:putative polymerase
MATMACAMILLALLLKRWIPPIAPVLVAPAVIAAMFLAAAAFNLQSGIDDFGGRIAHAVETFRAFTLANYAGLSLDKLKAAEDAGFAYLFMAQSLPVAMILWATLFVRRLRTVQGRFIHLAIAIYVALNLTVSWSIFTVKTAAILWFLLGRSIRDDRMADEGSKEGGSPSPTVQRPSFVQRSAGQRLSNLT